MCGKWRGMHAAQNQVALAVDQLALLLRMTSPQQEYQALALAIQRVDRGIGETFPALALMRGGLSRFDGEHGIEQEHSAIGPRRQAPVIGARNAQAPLDLLEHVLQRRRHTHARSHRKTQAMSLAGTVVRILTEDDYAHLVEGRVLEGVEDVRAGRIDVLAARLFLAQEMGQRQHVRPIEVIADPLLPGGFESYAIVQPAVLSLRWSATRNWNSNLVISSFSSTGFSTRSFAPARSSAA